MSKTAHLNIAGEAEQSQPSALPDTEQKNLEVEEKASPHDMTRAVPPDPLPVPAAIGALLDKRKQLQESATMIHQQFIATQGAIQVLEELIQSLTSGG